MEEEWPHFPEPSLLIHRKTLVFLSPKLLFTLLMAIHSLSCYCFWQTLIFLSSLDFSCFEAEQKKKQTTNTVSIIKHLIIAMQCWLSKNDALVSVFNGSFDSAGVENLLPCILSYRLNPCWDIGGLQTDLLGTQGCHGLGSLLRITQSVKNVMPQPTANEVP